MAFACSASSSSYLNPPPKKWDVFISFRGKDTREGVVSHLFEALKRKGINTFLDDKLRKGEQISPALLETIQESSISVVVFSENYADSPWCLDELVKILECMSSETSRQIVIPVFYKVDPTDVQELGGRFGQAFHQLKEKDSLHDVEGWIHALREISNLSGWDLQNIKSESELVEKIANDLQEKLSHMASDDPYYENLVGIDSRVRIVESLLKIDSANDNRTIGIWGMGGIGKTTLAGKVFNRIKAKFDSYYFVENVKEEIRKQSPSALRDTIVRQLLGEKDLHIGAPSLDIFVRRRLQSKKVLLVFDDVDDPHDLKRLAGECSLYQKGSRIIVTSRSKQVLRTVCPEEYLYQVDELNHHEALRLFCLYAFKQNNPREEYVMLSEEAIRCAQGNPLALRVFGSNLYSMGVEEWKSELEKLKSIPDIKIQEILRKSYDGLERNEKRIFLHIACFFRGECKDRIQNILKGCGFFPEIGISRLIDKSLITISHNNRLNVHDLLQQMGREIAYEECKQPGGTSILLNADDIYPLLSSGTGGEQVEGILLEYSGDVDLEMEINSKAFMNMHKLKILKIISKHERIPNGLEFLIPNGPEFLIPNGLEFLPKELRYLYWIKYPLPSLPLNFCPKLAEVHLPWSQLKQLWYLDKPLKSLKVMDLSFSYSLIRISELSGATNLEVLKLCDCKSLVEIPSSLQYLSKLTELDLEGCTNICSLPSCLHLRNLEFLNLKGCSKLIRCPDIPCNIKYLILNETAIEELPSSAEHCSKLIQLSLRRCTRFVNLPQSICNLKSLRFLEVKACLNMKELPDNIGDLESLQELNISGSGIKVLPSSVNQLKQLKELHCRGCDGLMLPFLTGLSCLWKFDLGNCGILEIPESVGSLVSLKILNLDGNNFERIPVAIKQLPKLKKLDLRDCKRLGILPELPCLLDTLDATNCSSLKSASISFLSSLENKSGSLEFDNCNNLDSRIIMDHVFMECHMVKQVQVSLCIPGVKPPEGMRYQNENGSSLSNIRLEDRRRIVGLSFCAVFDPRLFYHDEAHHHFCVKCKVDFVGESITSINFYFSFSTRVFDHEDPQHVFLWYSTWSSKKCYTHASLQFYTVYYKGNLKDETNCKAIIKCGFHPRYEDDCVGSDKKRRRNDDEQDEEDINRMIPCI